MAIWILNLFGKKYNRYLRAIDVIFVDCLGSFVLSRVLFHFIVNSDLLTLNNCKSTYTKKKGKKLVRKWIFFLCST